MPNWCNNSLTLSHDNSKKIQRLIRELQRGDAAEVFQCLRPRPEHEGNSWNCEHWGTKWDASDCQWEKEGENGVYINFETAWSPPIALYDFLASKGWTVHAYYYEIGEQFAGKYTNEDGDECYGFVLTTKSIKELPDDVVEAMGDLDDYLDEDDELDDGDEDDELDDGDDDEA